MAGVCAAVGRPLGATCEGDEDCPSDAFCFEPESIGATGAPRCTRPCCGAGTCGPPERGLVCWAWQEASGAVCWPHQPLGRAAPGDGPVGAPCTQDDACRSGRCDDVTGRCFDTCCADAGCAGGDVCRAGVSPTTNASGPEGPVSDEARIWRCGAAPTPSDGEDECIADNGCRSSLCAEVDLEPVGAPESVDRCIEPCCSSRECGEAVFFEERYPIACAVTEAGVRGCSVVLRSLAEGPVGAPCRNDDECRSGFCLEPEDKGGEGGADPRGSYCSDLCCTDDTCGDPSRFACRPGEVDDTWALRCERR